MKIKPSKSRIAFQIFNYTLMLLATFVFAVSYTHLDVYKRQVHRTGGTESCSKRTPRPAEGMGHRIWLYCNCKRAVGEKE